MPTLRTQDYLRRGLFLTIIAMTASCGDMPDGDVSAIDVNKLPTSFGEANSLPGFEQAKLEASDGAMGDRLGQSVSISGDTAIVGNTGVFLNLGATYVFVRNGTTWTQQAKLVANDAAAGDKFGWSVSISGDTAVVGAPADDVGANGDRGSAYVFERNGTTWTQQQKLLAGDAAANDSFGTSVFIEGDTIVVGAPRGPAGYSGRPGSAYVFTRNGSTWTQQQKLVASDATPDDQFGWSVSLSNPRMVVGAPGAPARGAAYVFDRYGSAWTQQQKLEVNDGSELGTSVSISGNTIFAGRIGAAAYVFERSGTKWAQRQEIVSSGFPFWRNNQMVYVSGDTALVGAPHYQGAIRVFGRVGMTWIQQDLLNAADGGGRLGWSVSLSGNTVLGGAIGRDSDDSLGAAYVFRINDPHNPVYSKAHEDARDAAEFNDGVRAAGKDARYLWDLPSPTALRSVGVGEPEKRHSDSPSPRSRVAATGRGGWGVRRELLANPATIEWQWLMSCDYFGVGQGDGGLQMTSLVARADGSVMVAGAYSGRLDWYDGNGLCGLRGGDDWSDSFSKWRSLGPHPFELNVDSSGNLTALQAVAQLRWESWNDGPSCGWCTGSEDRGYGPALWPVGGDVGVYYKTLHYGWNQNEAWDYCSLVQFETPAYALGTSDACALEPWQIAGDDSGNMVIRNASGLTWIDPSGQTVSTSSDPFVDHDIPKFGSELYGFGAQWTRRENLVALGPQGDVHAGKRYSSSIWLAKANASGALQWAKTIAAPWAPAADCFSFALDDSGHVLLAFSSTDTVDLGNGPLPKLGPNDLILAKLDPQGNPIWTKRFGAERFSVNSCNLRRTGSHDFALLLGFNGTVDLGAGVVPKSPVVAKFDTSGALVWQAMPRSPSGTIGMALSGHPSGAVFVGNSGDRLSVTKYQP